MSTGSVKTLIGTATALVLCCIIGSCTSQIPVAKPYPYSTQHKMQSARHWDALSGDVVSRMRERDVAPRSPIFVSVRDDDNATPFERAYGEILKTQLVNAGYQVAADDTGGARMEYTSSVVRHNSGRIVRPGRGIVLLPVAFGVYLAKNVGETLQHWWPWAIGGAVLAEEMLGHQGVGATDFELVVTTSMIEDGVYSMRHTDVFYIDEPRWNGDFEPTYRFSGPLVEVTQ